jgi:hypothetical protein
MSTSSDCQSDAEQPQDILSGLRIISPNENQQVDVQPSAYLIEVSFSLQLRILESDSQKRLPVNAPFTVGCRKAGVYQYPAKPPNDTNTYNLTRGVVTAEVQSAKVPARDPGGDNTLIVWVRKADGSFEISQEVNIHTRRV